ncbi:hypothetical protein HPB52_021642 [Rhipicephalus sanguineus]|uniref:Reverse transcriptase domain-containing protein n=1 Tax=Rhipicephalus sanguineus TaxID=34632 RepID=A0A9D4Q5M0_RHISA|nr:hypothetical protein HPB52_021642 [Rhipicephalus sanguineus]
MRAGAEQEESEPFSEDSRAPMQVAEPIHPRGAIVEELMTLVTKPPPRAFQAYRLSEITKRFLDREHVGAALESYLVDIFTEAGRAPRKPRAPPPQSRCKRKRQEAPTVLTYGAHTKVAHPSRGVPQGDPLSPLLFNLVLDEFFEDQPANIAFQSDGLCVRDAFCGRHYPHSEYQSWAAMYLKKRGLEANADKSRTFTILPSGRDKKAKVETQHVYTIGDKPISVTSHTSMWKYLGIHFDGTVASNNTLRGDLKLLLLRLSKAPLKPQQRMVALWHYLVPRLIHRLVLGPVSSKLLKTLDMLIRGTVRQWLNLPQDVTLGFFYAPVPEGGLGMMCLRTVIPAMRLRRLNSLIFSDHFQGSVAASKDFVRRALRQAEGLAVYKGDIIDSSAAERKYWTRVLHGRFDGRPLKRCSEARGSTAWIDESLGHVLQKCHRTHHQKIKRHDCILRYLAKSLREKDWHVVGTRVDLSEAHEHKRRKYLIPDMLMHITSATGASSYPIVSSITMTYRGTWATESARIMLDLGLGREHMKIATVRCLQGGLRAFRVHQRSTLVHNRQHQHGLGPRNPACEDD